MLIRDDYQKRHRRSHKDPGVEVEEAENKGDRETVEGVMKTQLMISIISMTPTLLTIVRLIFLMVLIYNILKIFSNYYL